MTYTELQRPRFVALHVEECVRLPDPSDCGQTVIQCLADYDESDRQGLLDEASGDPFWTLYGEYPTGEFGAIGDFIDQAAADHMAHMLGATEAPA